MNYTLVRGSKVQVYNIQLKYIFVNVWLGKIGLKRQNNIGNNTLFICIVPHRVYQINIFIITKPSYRVINVIITPAFSIGLAQINEILYTYHI